MVLSREIPHGNVTSFENDYPRVFNNTQDQREMQELYVNYTTIL